MRASDIGMLISLGRPQLSPGGDFAIVSSSRPDPTANRNVGQLWRVELPGGARRRLTRGTADTAPRLSPDGSAVAFLRADARRRAQIWVVASGGGEPVQATDAPIGVSGFAWSPDATRLAYVASVPEPGRYGTVEGLDAAAEPPRRVTGIRWHANGEGYIVDRVPELFVVDAPDLDAEPFYEPAPAPADEAPPRRPVVAAVADRLTSGSTAHRLPTFSADGSEILVVADDIEPWHPDLRSRLIAIGVADGAQRVVLDRDADLTVGDLAVAEDGTVAILAADVGADGVDFVAAGVALYLLDGDAPRRLTDPDRLELGDDALDLGFDGEDLLVRHPTRGRVHLLRVTRSGAVSPVVEGDLDVVGHAAAGGVVVATVATPDSMGELVLAGHGILTDFGAAAQAAGVVLPTEIEVPGRDGYPVHGWVATPDGDGPFPVILQIHGGPYASYDVHLFDETQVLVDAGYAVVYCNPRGSAGYGRAHGRAIRQAMGTVDLTDVLDFLDGALASDPRLDPRRVGIQGGSYGGYLTAWTIAHDHRFAGAIVERGFLDPATFQGTSDIGTFFGDEYVGTDPSDIARQSPMAVVSQVTTPTLVIHSEQDYRCPLEQATRYYSALKRQGTEAEMLIFPGENHELSRSGRPRHRIERFGAILDWWERHLPIDKEGAQ
ncbi:peptidase S9 [Microbacterium mangrovi]|uniref:Peptidase S9 n=1 Tax=Microbacterium mangrovi TaxID=1348253 RepID=A0A0B2A6U0_9MICO|nr:S9 family peptidase [Microbacterium mangrovi]KHK97306.1 peptidase S9 [Microbacterium mangrovi]